MDLRMASFIEIYALRAVLRLSVTLFPMDKHTAGGDPAARLG